ncbi:MAG: TlpA family protein disulfide reductase [Actinomycetota bacterium]|nr:TlpA family protein disulfide reductase [Actinomycetota bacterium]
MSLPRRTLTGFAAGQPVALGGYRGRPLVINFWATWCVPCREEMPALQRVFRESAPEVAFLGVNVQDNPQEAAVFIRQLGVTYDQASDPAGEFLADVRGFGMPTTLLVDGSGTIRYRHTGALRAEQLRALLRTHLRARI